MTKGTFDGESRRLISHKWDVSRCEAFFNPIYSSTGSIVKLCAAAIATNELRHSLLGEDLGLAARRGQVVVDLVDGGGVPRLLGDGGIMCSKDTGI